MPPWALELEAQGFVDITELGDCGVYKRVVREAPGEFWGEVRVRPSTFASTDVRAAPRSAAAAAAAAASAVAASP